VLHTALEGNAAHACYAPCSLAELTAKGYDYWALGHVHEHAVLQQSPWVVFSGNLQGRHIREIGPRGAVLVTADETGVRRVERLLVDVLRWHVVDVDASRANTLDDVVRLAGQAFETLIRTTPGDRYLSVRVRITGKTAAHGDLFGLEPHLRAEILGQAAAVGIDRLWVEKVRIETEPPGGSGDIRARSDAIADLQMLLAEAPQDAALLASLVDDLRQLVDKAPLELVQSIAEFRAIRNGDVAAIVQAVSPGLLAHLAKAD
jgi:DNA repair exonuclease SbcCD nuclease subunit